MKYLIHLGASYEVVISLICSLDQLTVHITPLLRHCSVAVT
jgi:hypothetical protein